MEAKQKALHDALVAGELKLIEESLKDVQDISGWTFETGKDDDKITGRSPFHVLFDTKLEKDDLAKVFHLLIEKKASVTQQDSKAKIDAAMLAVLNHAKFNEPKDVPVEQSEEEAKKAKEAADKRAEEHAEANKKLAEAQKAGEKTSQELAAAKTAAEIANKAIEGKDENDEASKDFFAAAKEAATKLEAAETAHKPFLDALAAAEKAVEDTKPLAPETKHVDDFAAAIKALKDSGANFDAKDADEKNVLHFAAERHLATYVEALATENNINAQSKAGKLTPLHTVVAGGESVVNDDLQSQIATIDALVEAGADLEAKEETEKTFAHYVVEKEAQLIFKHLADEHIFNIDTEDKDKGTIAKLAAKDGKNLPMVRKAIESYKIKVAENAELFKKDDKGELEFLKGAKDEAAKKQKAEEYLLKFARVNITWRIKVKLKSLERQLKRNPDDADLKAKVDAVKEFQNDVNEIVNQNGKSAKEIYEGLKDKFEKIDVNNPISKMSFFEVLKEIVNKVLTVLATVTVVPALVAGAVKGFGNFYGGFLSMKSDLHKGIDQVNAKLCSAEAEVHDLIQPAPVAPAGGK